MEMILVLSTFPAMRDHADYSDRLHPTDLLKRIEKLELVRA